MNMMNQLMSGLQVVTYQDKKTVDPGSMQSGLLSTYILGSDLNQLKWSVNGAVIALTGLAARFVDDEGDFSIVPVSSFNLLSSQVHLVQDGLVSVSGTLQDGVSQCMYGIDSVSSDIIQLSSVVNEQVYGFNGVITGQMVSGFNRMLQAIERIQQVSSDVQHVSGIVDSISQSGVSILSGKVQGIGQDVIRLSGSIIDQTVLDLRVDRLAATVNGLVSSVNAYQDSGYQVQIDALQHIAGFMFGDFQDSSDMWRTVQQWFSGQSGADFKQAVQQVNKLNNEFIGIIGKVDALK